MGLRAPQTREDSSDWGELMRKSLIALATAVATLGLVGQASTANAFLLNDRSPNVTAGQLIAGISMSAVYFSKVCHHGFNGRCARFDSPRSLKWYGLTTVGCMALSPIIGGLLVSMNEKRELRPSEVFMMTADCLVPIIGGLVMKAAFDAHPEWDAGTGRARR